MTEPLTPAGCDLRDFPHTPLFRSRLFGSTFHARASDAEWRAGVTLWLKSWDQVPAGSLPTDDIDLCRLAELARDLKTWKKVKDGALRGWVLCTDGRLYHPVVAEGINNAIEHKAKQRLKTAKARIAALEKHLKDATTDDDKARITDEIRRIKQTLSQSLSQTPREGEGRGKVKGIGSDPYGSGGDAADLLTFVSGLDIVGRDLTDDEEKLLWNAALALLLPSYSEATGSPKQREAKARAFIGGLGKRIKDGGAARRVLFEVIRAACVERPVNPETWLSAAVAERCGRRQGPNKQADLEESNLAAAAAFAGGNHG